MNTLPLISVIVPNYNHSAFLRARLESILEQTYTNFEIILLDDCSLDDSKKVLLQFEGHPQVTHCVFNQQNSGNTYKQWEKGIKLAKGEFIWIAESDDYCEQNFLLELSKPLIENREISLAYCQSTRINANNEITGDWLDHTNSLDSRQFNNSFKMEGNKFIERYLIYKNVIPNASGVLIRKDRIDAIGPLDLDPILKYNGDWLFYLKIISNHKIAFIEQRLNHFRYHDQSVIAKAGGQQPRLKLVEIEIATRKKMMYYLSNIAKPTNLTSIGNANKKLLYKLTFEKGEILIKKNHKIKGYFVLGSIINHVFHNLGIRKKVTLKWNKFYKTSFKK